MALREDLRDATRALRGAPRTAWAVVLTLSLALGLNTALFSVVAAVLLRPLQYPAADHLVAIGAAWPSQRIDRALLTAKQVAALREGVSPFEAIAAATDIRQNLTGAGAAQQVVVGWVSDDFLSLLGAVPLHGRLFGRGEPPGRAVLSYAQALSTFGAADRAVGRIVQLDGHPYEIVGVLGPGFRLHAPSMPVDIDVWKVPDPWWQNGNIWNAALPNLPGMFTVIARVRDGVDLAGVRAAAAAAAARERATDPAAASRGLQYTVDPLLDRVVHGVRRSLLLLWGAVGILLAIACANVINLLLVRVEARRRDLSIRLALGASRWRMFRLLLTEGALLASAGAAAGTLVAAAATGLLRGVERAGIPRLDEVRLDWRVFALAALTTLACTILLSLAPLLTVLRHRMPVVGGGRSVTGSLRLTRALVVAQIALSLVLLVSAGLLTKSLARLAGTHPGFEADRLLTFSVSLPGKKYTWPEGADRFHRELEDRIRALPGVRAAGVIWPLPLSGSRWGGRYFGGAIGADAPRIGGYRLVTPSYFEAMQVPLIAGRNLGVDDPKTSVIVSRSLAAAAFPGEHAVGRQITANPWGRQPVPFTIIGVAQDVRMSGLRQPPDEAVYFDSRGWAWTEFEVDVAVRTEGDPLALVSPIRTALANMDPDVPMAEVRPMRRWVDGELETTRTALWLVSGFAVAAGTLAAIGLYGMLAYLVARSQREMGIRLALGAGRARIRRLVLGRGVRLLATGLLLGIGLAMATTRLLGAYLFDVGSRDPSTLALVVAGFAVVGLGAAYGPARRAAATPPARALQLD